MFELIGFLVLWIGCGIGSFTLLCKMLKCRMTLNELLVSGLAGVGTVLFSLIVAIVELSNKAEGITVFDFKED